MKLVYPKFAPDADDIHTVLAAYLPFTVVVAGPARGLRRLPLCRGQRRGPSQPPAASRKPRAVSWQLEATWV
jgi:hypothetical protein